jgi:acetyl-CoA carboxylase carboxyl transferase subunit alpha
METAARFKLPVLTLIDTPGAFPGLDAEERGQSEAIARNLFVMADLPTPIISLVIGEGGSGGALAIGVSDYLMMLRYSTYSVISPEGCAAILWKDAAKAPDAAEALGITAPRLKELGLIDEVVTEPEGGAHRDLPVHMHNVKAALLRALDLAESMPLDKLLERRYQRLMSMGQFIDKA